METPPFPIPSLPSSLLLSPRAKPAVVGRVTGSRNLFPFPFHTLGALFLRGSECVLALGLGCRTQGWGSAWAVTGSWGAIPRGHPDIWQSTVPRKGVVCPSHHIPPIGGPHHELQSLTKPQTCGIRKEPCGGRGETDIPSQHEQPLRLSWGERAPPLSAPPGPLSPPNTSL